MVITWVDLIVAKNGHLGVLGCWDAHRSARPQVIERFTLEDLPAESGQDRGCYEGSRKQGVRGFGSSHWVSENQMSP